LPSVPDYKESEAGRACDKEAEPASVCGEAGDAEATNLEHTQTLRAATVEDMTQAGWEEEDSEVDDHLPSGAAPPADCTSEAETPSSGLYTADAAAGTPEQLHAEPAHEEVCQGLCPSPGSAAFFSVSGVSGGCMVAT